MKKRFTRIVRIDWNIRDIQDRRKKVDCAIVSYQGADGYEYRKSFKFVPGMTYDTIKSLIPLTL